MATKKTCSLIKKVTSSQESTKAIGYRNPGTIAGNFAVHKTGSHEGNIETSNRIGGTRYSHPKQEERLNSYREELTK
jgi:hypothetical protein